MSFHHESKMLLVEKVLFLKSVSLFEYSPEYILAEIADIVKEMEVHTGQTIFKSGDIGDSMYIIMKGTVNIHKDEKTLANLHENDFFGELSLLDTETRSASATAMSHCHLMKIEQADLYELMESRMEVMRAIIKTLCKRLRHQNEMSIRSSQNEGHGFNV